MASIPVPWSSPSSRHLPPNHRLGTHSGGPAVAVTGTGDQERAALLADLFGDEAVPSRLAGRLLRTREVAALFQVSERTVAAWARRGRIPSVVTPGGHRLYPADEMRRLLASVGRTEMELRAQG